MKNKEKFKNEIVDIICNGSSFAVDIETNKLVDCNHIDCRKCLFYGTEISSCADLMKKWANQEYKCNDVISQCDIGFLNYIPDKFKYIVRDKNGELFAYINAPTKCQEIGIWFGAKGVALYEFSIVFPMIKWVDKQPREIYDLKKLKVVENY